MPTPISPPPLTTREPEILPAYLSNGVIGLRVRQIPFWNGTAVISGYGGQDPVAHVEATTYAPYPLGGDIGIGRSGSPRCLRRRALKNSRTTSPVVSCTRASPSHWTASVSG